MNNRLALLSENNLLIHNDRYRRIHDKTVQRNRSISVGDCDRIYSKRKTKISKEDRLIIEENMNCVQLRRRSTSIASNEFHLLQVNNSFELSVLRRSLKFIRKSIRKRKSRSLRFRYMKNVSLSEYNDRQNCEYNDNPDDNSNDTDDVVYQFRR